MFLKSEKKYLILNCKKEMYSGSSILVTGAAGFIGSCFTNLISSTENYKTVVALDKLDYCSRIGNIETKEKVKFIRGDICNTDLINFILNQFEIDTVIHFAAQTHVDNSFDNSFEFTVNNVMGTHNLIDCCKKYGKVIKFVHMSTDEVYGEIALNESTGYDENRILAPSNPYAATKAGAEHIVNSYHQSYNFPVVIVRANNNYGPGQYPEKLIPKFCVYIKKEKKMTIHGKGISRRNFIHVQDTCEAIKLILEKGKLGEIYNIGSDNEYSVNEIAELMRDIMCPNKSFDQVVDYVQDRKFNDVRYFLNADKLKKLGWEGEKIPFIQGLKETIKWYEERMSEYDCI